MESFNVSQKQRDKAVYTAEVIPGNIRNVAGECWRLRTSTAGVSSTL